MQVKNRRKTISIEKKWDVVSRLEKDEWIVDICRKVRHPYISLPTVLDNADRITESAKSGTMLFL
jgi:hypothetical protein